MPSRAFTPYRREIVLRLERGDSYQAIASHFEIHKDTLRATVARMVVRYGANDRWDLPRRVRAVEGDAAVGRPLPKGTRLDEPTRAK